jgi:uncharacterized protein YndB with AHSA1/START domain
MKAGPIANLIFKRIYPASAAEIYEAWITPDLIREWLAPSSNVVMDVSCDAVVGGSFLIRSKAPDGVLHTIRGTYRELVPARRIYMTWAYSGPIELLCEMETLLEIDLREEGSGRTSMKLTQSHLATEEAANGYEEGWPSCFDKLGLLFGTSAGARSNKSG